MSAPAPARIPDAHKSAFWIYGVTAMVMREPLSIFVHDLSSTGPANPGVQLEGLRVFLVFLFLTCQFLSAGIFFDRVYLEPNSSAQFPHRSYPVDFISRMIELLVAVAAAGAVGIHARHIGGLAPFTMLVAILLLLQPVWLVVAKTAGYSTVSELIPAARVSALAFLLGDAIYMSMLALHFEPAKADAAALFSVVVVISARLAVQIRSYGHSPGDEGLKNPARQ
jgi:hypothetical protein